MLSVRLSNSLCQSDVLLFSEFIILLYTFLVISFDWYKEYMICLISLSKFSDVLPVFTCLKAIGNLWMMCLEVNILRLEWSEKPVPSIFIGNILPSKHVFSLHFSVLLFS